MSEDSRLQLRDVLSGSALLRLAMRGPLGGLFASGLLEQPALWGMTDLYLPLARLGAAAGVAGNSVDDFVSAVPIDSPTTNLRRRLARTLAAFEKSKKESKQAVRAWEAAFFGKGKRTDADLARIERQRMRRSHALILLRLRFGYVLLQQRVPAVRFDNPRPDDVEAIYGPFLEEPWRAFAPPPVMPEVEQSRQFATTSGYDYWLRFPAPSQRVGGTAWARVHEPKDAANAPTLIFGNGVFIEFDHVRYASDDVAELVRSGVRVIEIESPWHGRRVEPGYYGGEPFFARAPLSGLDLVSAQAQEIAVLIDWCRRRSRGKVGLGGISMGALATQVAAFHARHWPEELRPDMLALITFCERIDALPFDSVLARRTGLDRAMTQAGWTREKAVRWRPLTEGQGPPGVPPEAIVAVLGATDEVTPYAWAQDQVARWGVPENNLFVEKGGHFSTPLGLARNDRPRQRIVELLTGQ